MNCMSISLAGAYQGLAGREPRLAAGRRPGNNSGSGERKSIASCGAWRWPHLAPGASQTMRIDAIKVGTSPPDDVNVIVEVPIGGEPIKYEMDKAAGTLVVDRFLHTPMRYPGNYGFVPHTLSEDGDPIDVLVANTRPIVPGAVINVRPIGVLRMVDDAGGDEKILAVPTPKLTKRYEHVVNYTDLPRITLEQVQHFFEHYKDLEPGKWVKMHGWGDAEEAKRLIREAIERART
jgi:inorganic pyrophosphatase